MHTHLHADHVGWDTHEAGDAWVPTFTAARHLYTEAELEFARTFGHARRGRVRRLRSRRSSKPASPTSSSPTPISGTGSGSSSTPGHTPGHTSLWIESDGEHALITGDFMHHPLQFAEPQLAEIADADAEVARATRARMLREMARTGALVLGTHFPSRPGGPGRGRRRRLAFRPE